VPGDPDLAGLEPRGPGVYEDLSQAGGFGRGALTFWYLNGFWYLNALLVPDAFLASMGHRYPWNVTYRPSTPGA